MNKNICVGFVLMSIVFVISGSAVAANKPTVEPENCVTADCHGNYAKDNKFLHRSV